MTALPVQRHPLTVAGYMALGEDGDVRYELQEGVLVMSPSPLPYQARMSRHLVCQLDAQLPAHLEVLQDTDLDLELALPEQPGTVRRPNLMVVESAAVEAAQKEHRLLRAAEALLVIEIVSPGSNRMDYRIKRDEYAEARIEQYWIVDIQRPVSMLICRLGDGTDYYDNGEVTGHFTTTVPCPITIELSVER
ncbi:Uma2 family endonuclease [Nocardia stercoris]|uniref:Uma2 family endonuclease n=1 Tax=Nocardia stercoris TaxID=2483361 RepID=A0A3M2LBX7_9NOCA|nr:Uma2 family endonuclease [Nocardia stercoris]RMI34220.1 Uma2 family endonuclease [Nocardia stercoris]